MKRNLRYTVACIVLLTSALTAQSQTADTEAYQKGYNLILEENWKTAIEEFSSFAKKYRSSQWIDDASFCHCYAMEKSDGGKRAFECYSVFVNNHKSSKWIDDAKSNMIRLGRRLAKQGYPEYEAIIQSMTPAECRFDCTVTVRV